jgi:hypothetical protein
VGSSLLDQVAQQLKLVGMIAPDRRRHTAQLRAAGPPPRQAHLIGDGDRPLVRTRRHLEHAMFRGVGPETEVGQPVRGLRPVGERGVDLLEVAVELDGHATVPDDPADLAQR